MNYLRKLLGLCNHNWDIQNQFKLFWNGSPYGALYVQKCKYCGKMKKFKVENS